MKPAANDLRHEFLMRVEAANADCGKYREVKEIVGFCPASGGLKMECQRSMPMTVGMTCGPRHRMKPISHEIAAFRPATSTADILL